MTGYRLIIKPEQKENNQINLKPEQAHYLYRVLRLKLGDRFIAMDGQGNSWIAKLDGNQAEIIEPIVTVSTELPWNVTLITAIVKGNGFDEIVRCCTELGVKQIIPTITIRTLSKPSDHKVERWRKIAVEAVEQSERQIVPTITNPMSFTQVITEIVSRENSNYFCLTREQTPHLLSCLTHSTNSEIVIATGPEGGWTQEETQQALAGGFQAVNLGNRILRAITAPITALSVIAALAENGVAVKHDAKTSC